MRRINYRLLIIVVFVFVCFLFLIIIIFPKYLISKPGQRCLVDYHCNNLNCDEKNEKLEESDSVFYESMCVNNRCRCEWYGTFLHF